MDTLNTIRTMYEQYMQLRDTPEQIDVDPSLLIEQRQDQDSND